MGKHVAHRDLGHHDDPATFGGHSAPVLRARSRSAKLAARPNQTYEARGQS